MRRNAPLHPGAFASQVNSRSSNSTHGVNAPSNATRSGGCAVENTRAHKRLGDVRKIRVDQLL